MPITLRLTRRGDMITAEYSRDGGRSFRPAGNPWGFDEPLPNVLYAGLALSSHDVTKISQARFRGLEVRKR